MSAMNDDFLELMQMEIVALLQADEVIGTLPVLHERIGGVLEEAAKAVSVYTEGSGKTGVCVIALQPIADDEMPAAPGGILETEWTVLVLEEPAVNDVAGSGHQLKALKIARRILRVMKLYQAGGLATTFVPAKKGCIVPVGNPLASVAYEVRMRCTETSAGTMLKAATPVISPASGAAPQTITLTCATTGASIYYTTDGTLPRSGHGVLYAAPFSMGAAGMVRARAYKTGYIGSNTAAVEYT